MSNKVSLLSSLETQISLNSADLLKFEVLVDKALKPLIKLLPLETAQALNSENKSALAALIGSALTLPDLKAVSKKWDPKKKWPRDTAAEDVRMHLLSRLQDN